MAQQQHPVQGNEVPAAPQVAPPQVNPIDQALHQHSVQLNELMAEVQRQHSTIVRMKQQQSSNAIRPPKPDTFDGRHCDTFIYSLEKLFDYHGETDSERRVAVL